MKKTQVALSVALAISVAYPGAAWFTGKNLEQKLTQANTQDNLFANFKIVSQTYKRGVFSSTQEMTLEFRTNPMSKLRATPAPANLQEHPIETDIGQAGIAQENALQLHIVNHIQHGPVPGVLRIAAGKIDTELVIDPQILAELKKTFGDKKFLDIRTILNYGGGGQFKISSPAVVTTMGNAQSKLDWKGVKLDIAFDANYKKIDFDFNAPGLEASAQNGRTSVKMDAFKMSGHGERAYPDSLLFLGKSVFSIDGVDVTNSAANSVDFSLKAIKLESNTTIKDELLDSNLQFGIAKIKINQAELRDFHYDYTLSHLHAPSLNQFFIDIPSLDESKADPEKMAAMLQKWKQLGAEILKHDPILSLDRLSVASKSGEFKTSAKVKFAGATAEDFEQPQALLSKLESVVDLSLAEAVIAEIVEGTQADPEMRATIMKTINTQLNDMVEQSYIKREGQLLKSQITWREGKALVNGKAFPPVQNTP